MDKMNRTIFAARLNSFRVRAPDHRSDLSREPTTLDLVKRAAAVKGLNCVDLNYPDHLSGFAESELVKKMAEIGIALNGYAMRYYGSEKFKLGAFTNPDPPVRRAAIDLTKRGLDSLAASGGRLMTLWMGQDGFDYSFQADYPMIWEHAVEAIGEVADHNRTIDISVEYKPNEPRAFSLMPNVAATLLAVKDIDRPNLGVTLDFAHVLYAGEMPAFAAALVARYSRLLGVHLNDGYGKRDDGLMVGSVHPIQTIELLYVLDRIGYGGTIYFDTFPDTTGLDPVAECSSNMAAVAAMRRVADRLRDNKLLSSAIAKQDSVASQNIVKAALFGS